MKKKNPMFNLVLQFQNEWRAQFSSVCEWIVFLVQFGSL
jgi:hypothetical protein